MSCSYDHVRPRGWGWGGGGGGGEGLGEGAGGGGSVIDEDFDETHAALRADNILTGQS